MSAGRLAGSALVVLAGLMVGLPAMDWYSAATPSGRVSASGLSVSGVLWLAPVLGLAVGVAGAALAAAGSDRSAAVGRWAGPTAFIGALLILGAALWAAVEPGVALTVSGDGIEGAVAVSVVREAASWITPALAMVAATIGLAVSISAWRP